MKTIWKKVMSSLIAEIAAVVVSAVAATIKEQQRKLLVWGQMVSIIWLSYLTLSKPPALVLRLSISCWFDPYTLLASWKCVIWFICSPYPKLHSRFGAGMDLTKFMHLCPCSLKNGSLAGISIGKHSGWSTSLLMGALPSSLQQVIPESFAEIGEHIFICCTSINCD